MTNNEKLEIPKKAIERKLTELGYHKEPRGSQLDVWAALGKNEIYLPKRNFFSASEVLKILERDADLTNERDKDRGF